MSMPASRIHGGLSSRTELILGAATLLVLVRAVGKGKFSGAWSALWGATAKVPATVSQPGQVTTAPGGSSGLTFGGADPSISGNPPGFPQAGSFLNVAPGSYASGFSVPGVQALDTSGIKAEGGSSAAADWDYGVPIGSPVHLPAGQSYVVLPTNWGDPNRTAVVRTQSGGIMEFLHLSANYLAGLVGKVIPGGTVIGASGAPAGPNEAGSGAHLAVVVDPIAYAGLTGWQ